MAAERESWQGAGQEGRHLERTGQGRCRWQVAVEGWMPGSASPLLRTAAGSWSCSYQLSRHKTLHAAAASSRQQSRGRSPRCRLMLARCRLPVVVRACQYMCVKTQRLSGRSTADGSLVITADELAGICVHHAARLTVLAATLASWAEGQVVSALPTRGSGGQATGRRRRCRRCGVALSTC